MRATPPTFLFLLGDSVFFILKDLVGGHNFFEFGCYFCLRLIFDN